MKKIERLALATLLCGVLSVISFVFGRLAMTDIFHGEPDLSLEWRIVSLTFLPVAVFHVLAIVAAALTLRAVRRLPRPA